MKERLIEFLAYLKIGQKKFEQACGLSNGFVNNLGYNITLRSLNKIQDAYPELNINWLKTGDGEMINSDSTKPTNELKEKQYSAYINVKLVTTKARAGYTHAYYSDEYLEDMPTVVMEADSEYKGKYLAFEVDGDSMEPDYHKGDVVLCREIKRDLWRYKLHINDWDFVIAHSTQGIMLKQIIDHNVDTGDIICHSVNSEGFPDFTLNLKEVAFLYNVVEHRISGKNKRRYR